MKFRISGLKTFGTFHNKNTQYMLTFTGSNLVERVVHGLNDSDFRRLKR